MRVSLRLPCPALAAPLLLLFLLRGCSSTPSAADLGAPDLGPAMPQGPCSADRFCWENPLPQGNNFFAVWDAAGNDADAWAAGAYGTLYHLTGHPASWQRVESGTAQNLLSLWGSGSADVWAAGAAGTLLHYDGAAWTAVDGGGTADLAALWGSGKDDVWAAGSAGALLHWKGGRWRDADSGTSTDLHALWGSGADDIWAAGSAGQLLHYDGSAWALVDSGSGGTLWGLWGSARDNVFAVGSQSTLFGEHSALLRYDGKGWSLLDARTDTVLNAVFGRGANDIFIAGNHGLVLRSADGTAFAPAASGTRNSLYGLAGTPGTGGALLAVGSGGTLASWNTATRTLESGTRGATPSSVLAAWGSSADDLWLAGEKGLLWHRTPQGIAPVPSGTQVTLYGLAGTGPADVYAVGERGTVLHLDGDGSAFGILVPGVGTHLRAVFARAAGDLWLAGDQGTLLHFDGRTFAAADSGTTADLWGVWASGPTDAFAVGSDGQGGGVILHYDGAWSTVPNGVRSLRAVFGTTRDDVWFAGAGGTLLHFDGKSYLAVDAGTGTTRLLDAIAGTRRDDLWAAGQAGLLLHYDGTAWTAAKSGTANSLFGLFARGSAVYAVGATGTVLRKTDRQW